MDDEDIRHWQNLIAEHKRYLRIQEEKVAGFGKLNTPAHILKDIDDTSKSIAELEQRIRRRIRNAPDDGRLYNNEEVNEIYDLVSDIIRIEEEISFANLLIGSRESEEEPYKHARLRKINAYIENLPEIVRNGLVLLLIPPMTLFWYFFDNSGSYKTLFIMWALPVSLTILLFVFSRFGRDGDEEAHVDVFVKMRRDVVKLQEKLERKKRQLYLVYKTNKD